MKSKILAIWMPVVVVVFAFSAILAAENAERNWPEDVDKYIAAVGKSVSVIDMAAFKKILDAKEDITILDVREPAEYKEGFVPGAINIPRGVIELFIWKTIAGYPSKTDTSKRIYLYCALGGRAILATKALKDLGFTNVTAIDMKLADWVKANYPVTK
jgi:rhodanese-related sulfurtransferase